MKPACRATLSLLTMILGASALQGYYHYVHFNSTSGSLLMTPRR